MDITKARRIEVALIAKIIDGLRRGTLRAEGVTDSDGDIIRAEITLVTDPRRTRPLGAQCQQPGRYRKQRPQ